jgi:SAM-dependent methyltransferase
VDTTETKWNAIYQQRGDKPQAAMVLADYSYLLPKQGLALDLACGRGGNALLLAKHGLRVEAWDSSAVAIDQVNYFASQANAEITTAVRDVVLQPPEPESFDVIVVSLFLDRLLCPALIDALKPRGMLFYQTFCQQKINEQGPSNPDYLLADNELLQLFSGLKVRNYRQDALAGDHTKGLRNQALLVAEKV